MNEVEIRAWVESTSTLITPKMPLDSGEMDHIAKCLHHIDRWYHEDFPISDFLTAVVQNNFCEASVRADDTNRKAFYLYALFLHNHIPSGYAIKAQLQKTHTESKVLEQLKVLAELEKILPSVVAVFNIPEVADHIPFGLKDQIAEYAFSNKANRLVSILEGK